MPRNDDAKVYGVIAEYKRESPIIMEGYPMDYEDAAKRMQVLVNHPEVIRVAMFRAVYETGNQTLLPKEEK